MSATKKSAAQLLPIYRERLAQYIAEGSFRVDIERRLIARLEARAAKEAKQ